MANVRTMDSIHRPLAVTVSVAAQLLGFKDTKSIYTLIRQGKIRAPQIRTYFPDQLQITGRLRRRMLRGIAGKEKRLSLNNDRRQQNQ